MISTLYLRNARQSVSNYRDELCGKLVNIRNNRAETFKDTYDGINGIGDDVSNPLYKKVRQCVRCLRLMRVMIDSIEKMDGKLPKSELLKSERRFVSLVRLFDKELNYIKLYLTMELDI